MRAWAVPSGFSLFPGDIVRPPRAWAERTANVVRVTEPAGGGHFAPFEEPELYAEELRAFFRPPQARALDRAPACGGRRIVPGTRPGLAGARRNESLDAPPGLTVTAAAPCAR